MTNTFEELQYFGKSELVTSHMRKLDRVELGLTGSVVLFAHKRSCYLNYGVSGQSVFFWRSKWKPYYFLEERLLKLSELFVQKDHFYLALCWVQNER